MSEDYGRQLYTSSLGTKKTEMWRINVCMYVWVELK